ncbi:MAG: GNAT family N-acetyltransferase [Legionella sp.]|jgi:ribosomal protein S18 acetylase RimI-like enzyme|nr:GNAT family N-acetyltransferase [Legionella sp.]
MLLRTQQLDHASLIALQALLTACRTTDGHAIPVYPHLLTEHRSGPPSLLFYDHDELVGFLAAFHFHPHTCEISLLVEPSHRRQNIAHLLWHTMLANLYTIRPSITQLIISTPHAFHNHLLNHHEFYFDHSQHDMELIDFTSSRIPDTPLIIYPAEHAHISNLCLIDKACFDPNRQHPELRFQRAIATPNIHVFVAEHAGQIIGQVQLTYEKNQVRLTDLAVLPAWQGRGFGQALVVHCINHAFKHHQAHITLVVAAKNQYALKLYQHLGFQIYNTVDYYKHDLTDFKRGL